MSFPGESIFSPLVKAIAARPDLAMCTLLAFGAGGFFHVHPDLFLELLRAQSDGKWVLAALLLMFVAWLYTTHKLNLCVTRCDQKDARHKLEMSAMRTFASGVISFVPEQHREELLQLMHGVDEVMAGKADVVPRGHARVPGGQRWSDPP